MLRRVLAEGNDRARDIADQTLTGVHRHMHTTY